MRQMDLIPKPLEESVCDLSESSRARAIANGSILTIWTRLRSNKPRGFDAVKNQFFNWSGYKHNQFGLVLTILFSIPLFSIQASQYRDLNDHWSLTGETVYMERSRSTDKVLADKLDRINPLLTTKGLLHQTDFEPGYRVGIAYTANPQMSIEGNFLYISPWEGDKKVKGRHDLYYPFDDLTGVIDYQEADLVHAYYNEHFWDAELNYWWHWSPRWVNYFSLSLLGGLRYFHDQEGLKNQFTRGGPDLVVARNQTSDYHVHTGNKVGGIQFGINLQVNPMRYLNWEFTFKGGFAANYATQNTLIQDHNNTRVLRHLKQNKIQSAFFSDLSGLIGFSFLKHWNIHLGYEFISLSGVATAENQLSHSILRARPHFNTHGVIFISGLFSGITASF